MVRMNHAAARRRPKPSGTRPTNLSLSAALVDEARALGVNISVAAAFGLEQAVAKRRAERWVEDNSGALESYNDYIERHGLPLEKFRLF
jgi:antitoxin CcdA